VVKRLFVTVAALAIASTIIGPPAAAQLTNMPVYSNPAVKGFLIAGDVGFGVNDESGKNTAFAARGNLGLGKVILGAGIGVVGFDALVPGGETQNEPTFMGSVAYRFLGDGGLLNVSLQAGVGFTSIGTDTDKLKTTDIPISVGVGTHLPIPLLLIEGWVAPRYTFRSVSADGSSDGRNHFGFSAGVDVRLPFGIGAQVAGDWASLPELDGNIIDDLERQPFVASVGLQFGF